MSPTIVLDDGEVRYVVGSPGGATIITTVLQILMNRIDLGMTLPEAVAAPRASQRNAAATPAEPEFIQAYEDLLAPYGQVLTPSGDQFTSAAEIGAAAAIEVGRHGKLTAVAEPMRRGGGTALVVRPTALSPEIWIELHNAGDNGRAARSKSAVTASGLGGGLHVAAELGREREDQALVGRAYGLGARVAALGEVAQHLLHQVVRHRCA